MHQPKSAQISPESAQPEENPKALKVLNAARDVFFTHGFTAATTDMIQRKASVSKATVYTYYENKETLFVAVIEAECEKFTNTLRNISYKQGQFKDTLLALARGYLNIVLSPNGLALFRVVVAEAPRFTNLARTLYLAGPHAVVTMAADILGEAAQEGEVDLSELGRDSTANQLINLIRSEAQLECLLHPNARPSEVEIDKWVHNAITTFMRAYCRPAMHG